MVDTCPYTSVKPRDCAPGGSPNASCGLRGMAMCPHRFISCDKCATVVGILKTGEAVCGGTKGTGGIGGLSVFSSQFCCEPRTTLKIVY